MKELFKEITSLLSKGELEAATEKLEKLKLSALSREETLKLASLARQVGHPELAIRLLGPIVHPKGGRAATASENEKSTYAGALIKLGATEEALDILKTVDAAKAPEALLYQAHALIFQWNYAEAIPHLLECLKAKGPNDLQRIYIKLNLAASYLAERRYQDASSLLDELREETEDHENKILHVNALELSAQSAFFLTDLKAAKNFLNQGKKYITGVDTIEAFFIRKWSLLVEMNEVKNPESLLGALEELRNEAIRLKHWESVRDCDFWKALKTRDTALMNHVYFGTPYESFRKRIFLAYPSTLSIPETFDWNFDDPGKPVKKVVPLFELVNAPSSPFGLKSLSYKLLTHLVSDFYRPFRLGVLHAKLYPGEYYNPDSSPVRVYQTIKVLRRGFETLRAPLDVIDTHDGYRIAAAKGYGIQIPKLSYAENTDNEITALQKRFGEEPFSAPEVEQAFGISRSSVNRLIKRGIDQKVLSKEGHGYSVQYRFQKRSRG